MKRLKGANESFLLLLKDEIEEIFGKKIGSYGDCVLLSEEIFSKVSFKINANTLRRFYGLVKSDFSPSTTTLEILSKYCGFSSFDDFIRFENKTDKSDTQNYNSDSTLSYLISLFKYIPVKDYHDNTFNSVVKLTIQFLQLHPQLIDKFQKAISKTQNGQKFYYEQFVNIDALNSFYGDGLRYYLIEKKTSEAQIVGHSLLCLRCWLSENVLELKKHYDEVIKHEIQRSSHPMLSGRFFATQLLYSRTCELSIEKILINAQHFHDSIKQKANYHSFPYFEYVISSVLLLIGHYDEALYYISYSVNNYARDTNVEQGLYQSMDLIKALTLVKAGRKKEAKQLYHDIHPAKFNFLIKKTNTIMYLFLTQYLNKNTEKSDQQLEDLIKQTGFTKLYQILNLDR